MQFQSFSPAALAFGAFDGVHAGHRALLSFLLQESATRGLTPAILCFSSPGKPVLTTEAEKRHSFREIGGFKVLTEIDPGDNADSAALLEMLFSLPLPVRLLACGKNLSFGGLSLAALQNAASEKGIELITAETVSHQDAPISSDMLLSSLACGDLSTYRLLSGKPYSLSGRVQRGRGRGRTVGMPTANLPLPFQKMLPLFGVYASVGTIGHTRLFGITNIGRRPTVDNDERPTIETFFPALDRSLYGEEMGLELYVRVRDTRTFSSLEEVERQVQLDIAASEPAIRPFL